jgi:hypothetical protein
VVLLMAVGNMGSDLVHLDLWARIGPEFEFVPGLLSATKKTLTPSS